MDRVLELRCRLRKELTKVVQQPDGTTTLALPSDNELDDAVHADRMANDRDYVARVLQYNLHLVAKYCHISDDDLRDTINAFADVDPEAVEEMKNEAARRAGKLQRPPVGWELPAMQDTFDASEAITPSMYGGQ